MGSERDPVPGGAGGPAARHDPGRRLFGSDNFAGVHPEVLAAIGQANGGHVPAYGDDPYTRALGELARDVFGGQATIWPVFNGTGANVVALDLMTRRWEAVVCARSAHLNTDECGAPELLAGIKLLPVDTPDGRLTPALVDSVLGALHGEHNAVARVLTLTQSTELGTVYPVDDLAALAGHARARGLMVHLDGARLGNAAAALGASLAELTSALGVDVVSLGGTKAGLLGAEAVLVLNPALAGHMRYVRKYSAQLASKMRFASAQLLALYGTDLWLRNARAANAAAARLAAAIEGIGGVRLTRRPEANAVFAVLPAAVKDPLAARFGFYDWDAAAGEVRLMTSWDTTAADVDEFAAALRAAVRSAGT